MPMGCHGSCVSTYVGRDVEEFGAFVRHWDEIEDNWRQHGASGEVHENEEASVCLIWH